MRFLTEDSKNIAALHFSVEKARGALVYLHMMPATKESWREGGIFFAGKGYEGIAIDLRGHGMSDGGPEGFRLFSDKEHQASILDLKAAIEFLCEVRGFSPERISIVGASIGANLALQWIAEHSDFRTAILFSPGLNYRGVMAKQYAERLIKGQRALFIAARDDVQGKIAEESEILVASIPEGVEKKIMLYETGGHGTALLASHADLLGVMIHFLEPTL